jgi:hypothetical protein
MVDGEVLGRDRSLGTTRSINVNAPYFVGGLSKDAKQAAIGNVGVRKNFLRFFFSQENSSRLCIIIKHIFKCIAMVFEI